MPTSTLDLFLLCAAFFGSMTLLGLALGYGAERLDCSMGRKVYDLPTKRGQLATEILGTLLFHAVWLPIITLFLWSGVLRFSESWVADIVTFAVCWYGFQVAYYFVHRALHSKRLFWIHRWHHESLVTSPMTGLSMHPLEALSWAAMFLAPAMALSAVGMLAERGWIAFFAAHFVGNVAGHANAEIFPFRATRLSSILWSNPISYHSLHHARFDGHYSFACATMDLLGGTEFADWLEVHTRVMDGRPLRSLRERGSSGRPADRGEPEPAAVDHA